MRDAAPDPAPRRRARSRANWWGTARLLGAALARSRALSHPPVRVVLYRQLHFSGVEAVPKAMLLALAVGAAVIVQIRHFVGTNAAVTSEILVFVVVQQLAPLCMALLVVARSSTAVAAELASMSVARELRGLRSIGIDPVEYLVLPRILAIALSVVLLAFYFQVVALGGGLLLTAAFTDLPLLRFLDHLLTALRPSACLASLATALLFGCTIAAASCHHGLQVRNSITEIPQATAQAVTKSVVGVVLLQGLIVFLSLR